MEEEHGIRLEYGCVLARHPRFKLLRFVFFSAQVAVSLETNTAPRGEAKA